MRRTTDLLDWALELIAALAAQQPLVLVLDDMHWSDEASLDGLRRIGREIARLPVSLIVTYRDDELTRHHPLYGLIPVLVRESQAERIALRALGEDALREWIAGRYALDREAEDRLVDYVGRFSDGSPLFAGELLRALEDDRVIVREGARARIGALEGAGVPLLPRQNLDLRLSRTSGETGEHLADAGQCVLLLNDACEVAGRIGDDALAAMAVWVRGTMRFLAGENGLADAEAGDAALAALDQANLERIRREIGGRLPNQVARSAGLVWWHGYHGRPAGALELAGRIAGQLDASDRRGVDRGVCEAGRAFALSVLGRVHEARAAYHETRRLLEEQRCTFHVVTVTAFEFYLLDLPFFTTDLAERGRKVERLLAFASREGREVVQILPLIAISGQLLIAGRWDEFAGLLDAARSAPKSFFMWNYAIPVLATHARYAGRPERARELLRLVLPHGGETDVGGTGVPLRGLEGLRLGGELALDAGELDEAGKWIAAHDRWLDWSGYVLGKAEGNLLRARYHRHAGDPGAAQMSGAIALEQASKPRQPLALLAAHRFLAGLDVDGRRFEAAGHHLAAALELADACAAPFERALTLLVGARLDRATGDATAARGKLVDAIEICSRLGAKPALEEAERLLEEITASSSASVLSARELEVLALVADGLTDREVGERLYISPRTVNQHLRSIYNKLGVNSRAAATRRGVELGIF